MTYPGLLPHRLSGIFLTAFCASILGCSATVPSSNSLAGGQLRGNVHGGQQPVTGASVQLYAAGTTGYGSAATALLSSPVVTDASGSFTITGSYTCPSSTSQLYIVARGGNPGLSPGTNNGALALMAALGPCSLHGGQYTLDPNAFITINEVTTVASVYALAAFMGGDAAHLGTSSTNAIGLANSFQAVNNLVNTATGGALAITPAGNGTAPQAKINTLANIVASCVNSTGIGNPCAALATAATPSGGTTPTDTIQGTLNVARNPANNVSALFALASATPPFQPTVSPAPNDWTLGVSYTGIGLLNPQGLAIDGSGNVWIANNGTAPNSSSVTELSNTGTVLSGASGYTGGGMSFALGIAIDPSGNAWVTAYGNSNVVKLSSSGAILSGANGFTGGGLSSPRGIAIDGTGNAWVTDSDSQSVIKLSSSGAILSGAAGFTAGGSTSPGSIAIDSAGNAWVANIGDFTITELSNSGAVLSGASGYFLGGQVHPISIAMDASDNAWFINAFGNAVFELNSSGSLLSPVAGWPSCVSPVPPTLPGRRCNTSFVLPMTLDGSGSIWTGTANDYFDSLGRLTARTFGVARLNSSGAILSGPGGYVPTGSTTIAVDGSGNIWVDNAAGNNLTELIGAATPAVTPLSVGVKNHTLGMRP